MNSNNLVRYLRGLFKRKRLSKEAYEAYLHRLPDNIQVAWFRDDDFIIGNIQAEENQFITQGKSGEDFIEMVNDAVYTVYDIPDEYIDLLSKQKAFNPSPEERKRLGDKSISKAELSIQRVPITT